MAARRVDETAEEASKELSEDEEKGKERKGKEKKKEGNSQAFGFWYLTHCDSIPKVLKKVGSWL